jgi:retron-type reverse transcriptase
MSNNNLRRRLEGINKCSVNGEKARDLYKLMVNKPEIWELAYANICANDGATTKGVDGVTADGHSEERSREIMNQLRNGTYRPKPTHRVLIPKSNGKKRPLGIPTFTDKLVQEVCRIILEAIYEPILSKNSFGFRKGLGCHDALQSAEYRFSGTKWFIEFDIKGYFDNIDHQILVRLLKKKIEDERFIALIGWMLKAGYMENWKFNKTYSGTPQGGVISPILANIYLHELDVFMDNLKTKTDKGRGRKVTSEYKAVDHKKESIRKSLRRLDSEGIEVIPSNGVGKRKNPHEGKGRDQLLSELNVLTDVQMKTRRTDPMEKDFRRLQYVRYADDFLLGYIGSKDEAVAMMGDVKKFLNEALHLECSEEKTKVVHHGKGVVFLGYSLNTIGLKADANRTKRVTFTSLGGRKELGKTVLVRVKKSAGIQLGVPDEKIRSFIRNKGYGAINNHRDYRSLHRAALLNNSDYEIVAQYAAEFRGFAEYYKLAGKFYQKLSLPHYIAQQSLVKTLAYKHKISCAKVYRKYKKGDYIEVTDGKYTIRWFLLKDVNRKAKAKESHDTMYHSLKHAGRSEIIERLSANQCEYCGKEGGYFEIHHVRKMADIKDKKEKWQEVMIARNRKKLVLCIECHDLLHAGKLPDYRNVA